MRQARLALCATDLPARLPRPLLRACLRSRSGVDDTPDGRQRTLRTPFMNDAWGSQMNR
jgi:hypothetical protein